MRLSVTVSGSLHEFLVQLSTKRGISVGDAVRHLVMTHSDYAAYEKELAKRPRVDPPSAPPAAASVTTTTVVPTPSAAGALPPTQPHRLAGLEAYCQHGSLVSDAMGYAIFCHWCHAEEFGNDAVCWEHSTPKPCQECEYDPEAIPADWPVPAPRETDC